MDYFQAQLACLPRCGCHGEPLIPVGRQSVSDCVHRADPAPRPFPPSARNDELGCVGPRFDGCSAGPVTPPMRPVDGIPA